MMMRVVCVTLQGFEVAKTSLVAAASQNINTAKAGYLKNFAQLARWPKILASNSEYAFYLTSSIILAGIPLSARAFRSSSPISPSHP